MEAWEGVMQGIVGLIIEIIAGVGGSNASGGVPIVAVGVFKSMMQK